MLVVLFLKWLALGEISDQLLVSHLENWLESTSARVPLPYSCGLKLLLTKCGKNIFPYIKDVKALYVNVPRRNQKHSQIHIKSFLKNRIELKERVFYRKRRDWQSSREETG